MRECGCYFSDRGEQEFAYSSSGIDMPDWRYLHDELTHGASRQSMQVSTPIRQSRLVTLVTIRDLAHIVNQTLLEFHFFFKKNRNH